MKLRLSKMLAMAILCSFGLIPFAIAAEKQVVIKLGHTGTTEHAFHLGGLKLSELMKERTKGAVDIQVFPNGQLGSESALIELVAQGAVQMMLPGGMTLSMVKGWEPLQVAYLPYMFPQTTEEELKKKSDEIYKMPFIMEFMEKARKVSGIRVLDLNWFYGMRHVTTKKTPVQNPEDLKGLKIRTMPSPIARFSMEIFGASVTPMSFGDIYTALQMGVLDGQENPIATIDAGKFYEVQKYLSLTGHTSPTMVCIINDKFFNSLTPETQNVLVQSVHDANVYQSDIQIKANQQALKILEEKGMTIVTVDKTKFAAVAKKQWSKFENEIGKDFYEKFVTAAANN
jgi:TRAP-type transport system periplasmic protein